MSLQRNFKRQAGYREGRIKARIPFKHAMHIQKTTDGKCKYFHPRKGWRVRSIWQFMAVSDADAT